MIRKTMKIAGMLLLAAGLGYNSLDAAFGNIGTRRRAPAVPTTTPVASVSPKSPYGSVTPPATEQPRARQPRTQEEIFSNAPTAFGRLSDNLSFSPGAIINADTVTTFMDQAARLVKRKGWESKYYNWDGRNLTVVAPPVSRITKPGFVQEPPAESEHVMSREENLSYALTLFAGDRPLLASDDVIGFLSRNGKDIENWLANQGVSVKLVQDSTGAPLVSWVNLLKHLLMHSYALNEDKSDDAISMVLGRSLQRILSGDMNELQAANL